MFWLRIPSRPGTQSGADRVGSKTLVRLAPTTLPLAPITIGPPPTVMRNSVDPRGTAACGTRFGPGPYANVVRMNSGVAEGQEGVYVVQSPSGGGRTSWLLVQVATCTGDRTGAVLKTHAPFLSVNDWEAMSM